jgi:hypothetical protein
VVALTTDGKASGKKDNDTKSKPNSIHLGFGEGNTFTVHCYSVQYSVQSTWRQVEEVEKRGKSSAADPRNQSPAHRRCYMKGSCTPNNSVERFCLSIKQSPSSL